MKATLTTVDDRPTLRFERHLRHPAEKVWRALTDPAEMAHWFPQSVEGRFEPGGTLRFRFGPDAPSSMGGEPLPEYFDGQVLEIDEPRVLAYSWGDDVLRFELTPTDDGCVLVFTDAVDDKGKSARDGAGWHACLDSLFARLDGTAPEGHDEWRKYYEVYRDRFGPDASSAPLPD